MPHHMTAYCRHALPISIILAHAHLRDWYYQHFIQIYSTDVFCHRLVSESPMITVLRPLRCDQSIDPSQTESIWRRQLALDFIDNRQTYDEVLHRTVPPAPPSSDIIILLRDAIRSGSYALLNIDLYYVKDARQWGQSHTMSPMLIVGFNDTTRTIIALTYDKNHFLQKSVHEWQHLEHCFRLARPMHEEFACYLNPLELIEVDRKARRPFDVSQFTRDLRDYCSGRVDLQNILARDSSWLGMESSLWSPGDLGNRVYFGWRTYDHFLAGLDDLMGGGSSIEYLHMHFLYEHKVLLLERLNYVAKNFLLDDDRYDGLARYQQLVEWLNSARFKYLKYEYTAVTGPLEQTKRNVERVRDAERQVLEDIGERLQAMSRGADPFMTVEGD
jgi:hypothetical protein